MPRSRQQRLDDQVRRVSVSFPLDDYESLAQLAEEGRVSVAWVVRTAVAGFLATAKGNHSRVHPQGG